MSNSPSPARHPIHEKQIRSLGKGITSRHDLKSQLGRQWLFLVIGAVFALAATSSAQDWIRTGTGLGVEKVRLAASDFKASTQDPKNPDLQKTFQQHSLERPRQCRDFHARFEELLSAAISGTTCRYQICGLGLAAARRLDARLRQPRRCRRQSDSPGLAVRSEESNLAAGSRQAVQRFRHQRRGAPHRAQICR